ADAGDGDDTVARNDASVKNVSRGSAEIESGSANAIGVGGRNGAKTPDVPDLCKDKDKGEKPDDGDKPDDGKKPDDGDKPKPDDGDDRKPPVQPVVDRFDDGKVKAAALAVTGVSVAAQILFGLLLLAFGFFLRRKGQTV
ncbi:MAG: hypothetical protein M3N37_08695, partial [Actinomycetota bacterium]|nr:hypothetical protein [Actinomycetota bacterium]